MYEEDDEGDEEAAADPNVDELEVGSLRDGLVDALVHGVHDQHDRQRKPDAHVEVEITEEQRHLNYHQQARSKKKLVNDILSRLMLNCSNDLKM